MRYATNYDVGDRKRAVAGEAGVASLAETADERRNANRVHASAPGAANKCRVLFGESRLAVVVLD